jgi:hypothetical protein
MIDFAINHGVSRKFVVDCPNRNITIKSIFISGYICPYFPSSMNGKCVCADIALGNRKDNKIINITFMAGKYYLLIISRNARPAAAASVNPFTELLHQLCCGCWLLMRRLFVFYIVIPQLQLNISALS